MERVEVVSLRNHVERQRRARGERYMVKPERVAWLMKHGLAKPAAEYDSERAEADTRAVVATAAEKAEKEAVLSETELDALLEQWEPRVSPEQYLKRWPDGKHAAMAQQIVDKLAEA